jgi:hypothetical protein
MEMAHFELPGKPSQSVRQSETQDGAVLLDIRQGLCFSINPVGSRIWNMMKEGQSFDGIVDGLAMEFGVPRQQVCTDVMEFATMLHKHGLLLTGPEQGSARLGAARSVLSSIKKLLAGWRLSRRPIAKSPQDMH